MKTAALVRASIGGTTWLSRDGLAELVRRDRAWIVAVATIGILSGLCGMIFLLVESYRGIFAAGLQAGHPEQLLVAALAGSAMFIFITGIPLALSVLYYSSDLRMLCALPVSPLRIVTAKGILLYLYSAPLSLFFVVPALWIHFAGLGASPVSVISAVLGLLVFPLFPLACVLLVVVALAKSVNLSRFRVALEVAGMTVGIAALLAFLVSLVRGTMAGLDLADPGTVSRIPSMFDAMVRALPPLAWAVSGFSSSPRVWQIVCAPLLCIALSAAALALVQTGFVHDVTERRASRRSAGRGDAARPAVRAPRGVIRGLVARELSILASSSTFIFEVVGECLILPLVLGIYSLILPKSIIAPAMSFMAGTPWTSLIVMAAIVMMTGMTTVSATSISREGRLFGLSLSLPVAGRMQMEAKLLLHMLFFSGAFLLDVAIVYVVFPLPAISLVFLVPAGIAYPAAGFAGGMFFDLKKPTLKWTHPQQAMKNNMNAMAGMGVSFAIVAGVGVLCALAALAGVSPFLIGCGAAAAGGVIAALLLRAVFAYADKRFAGGLEMEG